MDPQVQIDLANNMAATPHMPIWAILLIVVVWLFVGYCTAKIAVKTGLEFGKSFIMALIPIVNIYLLCKMASKPDWWLLLMLIPLVNFIITIILWVEILKKLGRPGWWVILLLFIPIVNVIIFLMLAFGETKTAPAA